MGLPREREKVSSTWEVFWVGGDGAWTILQDSWNPPRLPELAMPIPRQLEVEFVSAFNARDAKGAAEQYAANGEMVKDGSGIAGNRREIECFWQKMLCLGAQDMWCNVKSSTWDDDRQRGVEESSWDYTVKGERVNSTWEAFGIHCGGGWTIIQDALNPPHLPEPSISVL